MLTHTTTHNIYSNQSFSIHISSQTKLIILQNPSDTNFIILQNPSMFREIEKKHWNTNKIKTEHLNKKFEIQTLKFRGTQNRARWVYGGRERKHGHLGRGRSWWTDWCRRRWEMRVSVELGLCLDGFFSQPCPRHEIMRCTTPMNFDIKAGSQKMSRKRFYVGWVRWVNGGGWVMSNVIWRKWANKEGKGSVRASPTGTVFRLFG